MTNTLKESVALGQRYSKKQTLVKIIPDRPNEDSLKKKLTLCAQEYTTRGNVHKLLKSMNREREDEK